jgi:hypothetical protein
MRLEMFDDILLLTWLTRAEIKALAERWLREADKMPDGPEQLDKARAAFFLLNNLSRAEANESMQGSDSEQADSD